MNAVERQITSVEDALLGRVLTSVPELPGLGFLFGALLLAEDEHDDTLKKFISISLVS